MIVIWQLFINFVTMTRQSFSHSTDAVVMIKIQGLFPIRIIEPIIPHAHQSMLQNRQLIWIIPNIIQQLLF